jgi:glucokinase
LFNATGEEIFNKAQEGDNEAIKILTEFGIHIGNAISAIILSVDPEIIILGGSVSNSFKYFRNAMEKVLEKFSYQHSVKKLKIVKSTLVNVSILGAAALYYENNN